MKDTKQQQQFYFLEYRHMFAHGYDDWQLHVFDYKPCNDTLEEFRIALEDEYDWSDKYRGVIFKEVTTDIPEELLEKEISRTKNTIKYAKNYLEALNNLKS